MPILAASNINHAYGDRIVLDGCTFTVEPGERIGLVGRNGAGKSTLLKCLTGEIKPDAGVISTQRGARIGYLQQDPKLDPEETLRGAAEAAFERLHELHRQLDALYHEMAEETDTAALEKLLKKQEQIETDMNAAGGYAVDHLIDAVLHGLGFVDAQFSLKVSDLSGGQRSRLALARLLLEQPDCLLLDEPTNHLDIQGRLWLEEFLAEEFRGAVVIISHDRYLLDRVVSRIVEVEHGRTIDYPGNYHAFREIRAERRLSQFRAYEKQQTAWRKEEEYIRRFKAGQRAKQAKGRDTKLQRQKEEFALERPMEVDAMKLILPKAERSSDMVASAIGLTKAYTDEDGSTKTLFRDLTLKIMRGERWGILGPNGAGKSTLIRCLLAEQSPDHGSSRLGSNLRIGYFRQIHTGIDPEMQVYRYLQQVILKESGGAMLSEQAARDLAGAFLFSGEDQEKEMRVLSGGERARAVLAGLMASAKNLLVLDEPTNHLDIPSAERLEDALALEVEATSEAEGREGGAFDGTLILISHDRAMIDACCNNLLILDGNGGAEIFAGNYSAWRDRQNERAAARTRAENEARQARDQEEKRKRAEQEKAKTKPAPNPPKAASTNALERLKPDQLEKKIESIQARVKQIDAEMADPDVWSNHARCSSLGNERAKLLAELEPLEFEWLRRAETT